MTSNLPPIPPHGHPDFDRIFGQHLWEMYPRLKRLVYDRLDPENFCQDVAYRAWLKREFYDPSRPLAPWVFRLAYRMRVDIFGRGSGRHQPEQLDHESVNLVESHPETDPVHRCLVNLDKEALFAAINSLSVDERTAIVLRFFDELNYADIGDIMGRSSSAVGGLILRGKEKLFNMLKQPCNAIVN